VYQAFLAMPEGPAHHGRLFYKTKEFEHLNWKEPNFNVKILFFVTKIPIKN
jgi:hypothetical protein